MQEGDPTPSPPSLVPATSWWGPYVCLLLGFAPGAVVQKLGTEASRPYAGTVAMLVLGLVTFVLAARRPGSGDPVSLGLLVSSNGRGLGQR